ncbi:hypothetical protein [Streptosporangium sp. NPDC001681]|uniref:hypothetical protein n=1 Tax=Streptosporangium sp. NPDC001681 TaxID=3154395 RepID=UPI00333276DA
MALNIGELFATIDVRDRATAAMRRISGAFREHAGKIDGSAGSISKSATAMGARFVATALQASVMAGAMAVSAQSVVAFAGALAPAGGIVAALPAAFALAAAAVMTFKIALSGVGDAFKAALGDDPKKFEAAIAGLSPAAQAATRDVRGLKPAVDGLKSSVQDAFFVPLTGQITAAANALIGPLQSGMSGAASQFGRLGGEVLKFGQSAAAISLVNGVFQTLTNTVGGLESGTMQRLLQAVAAFVSSSLPAFAGLGSGINTLTERFTAWLNAAAEAGKPLIWVQNALTVFRQLGSLLGDVGGIVRSVFAAMETSGGGALGIVGQLASEVNAFLKSAEGQQTLVAIFQSIQQVGGALFPIFAALAGSLALVAPHAANIAAALGPGIAAAVSALGPALAATGPALTAFAAALSQALADPAVQEGLLAIGQGFASTLTAITPLVPVVVQLVAALAQMGPVLIPLAALVATGLQISSIVGPIISVVGAFGSMVPAVTAAATATVTATSSMMASGIAATSSIIVAASQVVGGWVLMGAQALAQAARMAAAWLIAMGPIGLIIAAVVAVVAAIVLNWDKIKAATAAAWAWVGTKISEAVAKVKSILAWFGELGASFDKWVGAAKDAAVRKFVEMVTWVVGLPARIKSALGSLGTLLTSAGRDLLAGLWQGVQAAGAWLKQQLLGFFRNIMPDWVREALGIASPSKVFAAIGRMLPAGMAVGIQQASGLVMSSLDKLTTMVSKTTMPDMVVPGVNVPDGLAGGQASARTVVNVVNHYPQAEPTSVTVNRGLQYTGALGVV